MQEFKSYDQIIGEIQALRELGKTEEALKQIDSAFSSMAKGSRNTDLSGMMEYRDQLGDLYAEKAWCHYRRKEYDLCRQAIANAGPNVKARECLAQLAAYVEPKQDALLERISSELHDSIGVQNALMIRARDKDSTIEHDAVLRSVHRVIGSSEISATNVINNAGRFFHAKSRGGGDHFAALGLLELAFIRYGTGNKNLHHRAALLFWQSKIVEQLSGKEAALTPARGSLYLWERQVALDPTNQAYVKNLDGAKVRIAELGG